MSQERRDDPRVSHSSEVVFQLTLKETGGEEITVNCNTEDISKGGLRIVIPTEIPIGLIAELCVSNQDDRLMLLYAELRWVKPHSDGFECGFMLLDAENSDLDHWIKQSK